MGACSFVNNFASVGCREIAEDVDSPAREPVRIDFAVVIGILGGLLGDFNELIPVPLAARIYLLQIRQAQLLEQVAVVVQARAACTRFRESVIFISDLRGFDQQCRFVVNIGFRRCELADLHQLSLEDGRPR
ncbi:hypothetical protein D3C80_1797700 [compost metagenome]